MLNNCLRYFQKYPGIGLFPLIKLWFRWNNKSYKCGFSRQLDDERNSESSLVMRLFEEWQTQSSLSSDCSSAGFHRYHGSTLLAFKVKEGGMRIRPIKMSQISLFLPKFSCLTGKKKFFNCCKALINFQSCDKTYCDNSCLMLFWRSGFLKMLTLPF